MKLHLFFESAFSLLMSTDASDKVKGVRALFEALLDDNIVYDHDYPIQAEIIGGYPPSLMMVSPKDVPRRRVHTVEGRAAMVHAILHIEFNAINIALDACYRFRHMPHQYYEDWLRVACEEAYHFLLLLQHLQSMGFEYGDFPVHNGLWEMAQKTGYDVLVRMALVPRLLEARGLDVTPDVARKLHQSGDNTGAEILRIIYHDEIGHVKVGNHWFYSLCKERGEEPMGLFVNLLKLHAPDYLRGPLAIEVRQKAGFHDDDLAILNRIIQCGLETVS